jgi:putative endonuclease
MAFLPVMAASILYGPEYYEDMRDAIAREKQIKAGSRQKKLRLISAMNPNWRDLYRELSL